MFSRPPSAAELIFGSDDDIVALSEGLASSWAPVVHVSNGSHYDAFVLEKCSPRLEAERRMRLRFRSHPGKWPSHVLSALSAHRGLTSVNLNLGYCIMTDNWHLPPASPASSKSQDLGTWLAALPRLAHLELTHDNFTSISDRWGAWPKNIERQRVCGAWMEAHLGPLYQGLSKSKSIRSLLLPMMACENVNTEPLAHMAQLEQLFNVRHDMIEHMAINTPNVVNLWRLDVMAEANNFKPRLTAMNDAWAILFKNLWQLTIRFEGSLVTKNGSDQVPILSAALASPGCFIGWLDLNGPLTISGDFARSLAQNTSLTRLHLGVVLDGEAVHFYTDTKCMSKLPQNLRQLELLDGSARNPYNTWCNAFYPAIGTSNTLSRLVVHGQVDTISFATIMTAVILNERASPIDMRFSSVTDGMMNTETGAIMTKAISGEQRVVMGLLVGFQDSHLPPMKKDFETAYIASVMRNPHLLRIDVIHNDSGEVEAKIARNRIRVLSWAQVAIALSCLRANLANTFRDACRPLIPAIMECSVVHPFGEIEGPYFASVNGRSSVQPLTLKRVDAFLSTRFACSHLEIVGHKRKYA